MPQKRWVVDLTPDERARLEVLTRRGTAPVREVAHARVLLLAADGHTDEQIATTIGRGRSLVERTRKRFVLSGLEAALWDKPRPGSPPKLDARGRATLIALACANPPEGRTCWTMQLLANELVARRVVGSIPDETVRRELEKNGLKPWLQEHWCIPEVSPAVVAAMEDVLDLYAEPYDPDRPVGGFDERPLQLVAETRTPLPAEPGHPRRFDDEYRRNGTCNLFTTVEPLTGWRHIAVTERRTAVDVAQQPKWLVDEAYPDAGTIRIVLDNLNVHATASLYAAFPAPEARRLAKKLGFHFTPQARQLAERGRMRAGGAGQPVLGPTAT
jgi:transposase